MSKLLVKFDSDWADEFSVYGFRIYTVEAWEAAKAKCIAGGSYSYSFGTNESWDDEEPKYWLEKYEVKPITDDEEKTLLQLFGKEWGNFPRPEEGQWDEEEEDDE